MERKHKFLIQRLAAFVFEADTNYGPKVEAIAAFLSRKYPRSTKEVLDYFWFCLQKAYRKRYATVAFSGPINFDDLKKILSEKIHLNKDTMVAIEAPELISGFKIQLGDDVWDHTLKAQLSELMNTLK
jgi:F0F1-type ATP synthase delta subunit